MRLAMKLPVTSGPKARRRSPPQRASEPAAERNEIRHEPLVCLVERLLLSLLCRVQRSAFPISRFTGNISGIQLGFASSAFFSFA